MKAQLKKAVETVKPVDRLVSRVKSETPTHFKRWRTFGLGLAGAGFAIKIVAALFPPTMPIGILSLAPELIATGLSIAGVSTTAKK